MFLLHRKELETKVRNIYLIYSFSKIHEFQSHEKNFVCLIYIRLGNANDVKSGQNVSANIFTAGNQLVAAATTGVSCWKQQAASRARENRESFRLRRLSIYQQVGAQQQRHVSKLVGVQPGLATSCSKYSSQNRHCHLQ